MRSMVVARCVSCGEDILEGEQILDENCIQICESCLRHMRAIDLLEYLDLTMEEAEPEEDPRVEATLERVRGIE